MKKFCKRIHRGMKNETCQKVFKQVMQEDVVQDCLSVLMSFDKYTYQHCVRVAASCIELGYAYFIPEESLRILGIAGATHDIGKVHVGRNIICKPSKLTSEEFDAVKTHVLYSCIWLQEYGVSKDIISIVSEHHEKRDGSGYPFGKKGGEISLGGRIIAVADIYDAITVKRVYNDKALSNTEALDVLYTTIGVDPYVIETLKDYVEEGNIEDLEKVGGLQSEARICGL